ncbi:MAG: YneF family protein [Acholeplasmatales bacterium]|nr:YneF family protein [Acholeplasmatales bacterium]
MTGGSVAGIVIVCLIVGLLIGFFASRYVFKRELKKNPPMSEKMVRAMMSQMGRTPSEKQVRAVMRQMEDNK